MNQSTKDLSQELSKREGIETISVKPYDLVEIIAGSEKKIVQGPATILINID